MPRWMALTAAAFMLCSVSRAATVEEAEAKIREAWNKEDLFSAVLRVEAMPATGSRRIALQADGNTYFQRAEGVERYRNVLRVQYPEPMKAGMAHEAVFNGTALYVFNESLGNERSEKVEHAIASGAVPPGGGQLLDALHDAGQITAVAESAVGESKVYVLEGNVPESDGETPMFSRFVATIDQETGALHKLELFERPQVKTATITLKDFDFSPSIDPASFDVSAAETEAAN